MPAPVIEAIEDHLAERETRRAQIHEAARVLRRRAQGAMRALHEGAAADGELDAIADGARALATWVRTDGRGDEGLAHDALQEAVEAQLLAAVLRVAPLPGPGELGVEAEVYLAGLGDLAGELRRLVLGALTESDLGAADRFLETLDDLYRTLMRFDTARAIVALKPKQDTARALLERTRGDVALAHLLAQARLHHPSDRSP